MCCWGITAAAAAGVLLVLLSQLHQSEFTEAAHSAISAALSGHVLQIRLLLDPKRSGKWSDAKDHVGLTLSIKPTWVDRKDDEPVSEMSHNQELSAMGQCTGKEQKDTMAQSTPKHETTSQERQEPAAPANAQDLPPAEEPAVILWDWELIFGQFCGPNRCLSEMSRGGKIGTLFGATDLVTHAALLRRLLRLCQAHCA